MWSTLQGAKIQHQPRYRIVSLLIVLSLIISTNIVVNAATQAISFPATSQFTFNASADSCVAQSTPDQNFGSSLSLRIDNTPITRSYLRFVVSGLGANSIQAVKLRVYANSANLTGYSVSAVSDNSWAEKTITFNNSPAPGTLLGNSQAFSGTSWVEVDLSGSIRSEGTYNLVLTTKNNTNTSLASRESSGKAPQLVITAASIASSTPTNPVVTKTPVLSPTSPIVSTPTSTIGPDQQPVFPIRAAFYYPWFPQAWTQSGTYPYTNYTPTLGYYSSTDLNIVKKHIAMMTYANIQAGIASWWGQGQQTDTKIAGLLSAATGTNFRWALYYENESQGDPTVSQIQNDLVYIRDNYGKQPTYLRVNGKFVVFVYAASNDACGMADRWKQANTVGAYIVLKVFSGYANCASQPNDWHQYAPAVAADKQGQISYSISPGFWLKGQSVRLARDLNRWSQNVKDMVASGAKWQLITTFSEWGEGTIVEPAVEWASASGYGQYLDVLHDNGNTGPVTPTKTTTPTQPATGTSNVLLLAGDICKFNTGATDYTSNCKKTGDLVRSILAVNPGAEIQTLGDNVNNDGGLSSYDAEYDDLYDPNWGSFLNVTHALMGNHDTYTPGGTVPYFTYFGAQAGPAPIGYYSYDIGSNWHVIVLNAQCSKAGGCEVGSPQYTWLEKELSTNTKKCVMAAWHQPRWTSGRHTDDALYASWWDLLYKYKADIVANGHNHNYERFDLINPRQESATDGIREFVVGTGGAPGDGYTYAEHPLDPNEYIRNQSVVYGVLKLTLFSSSYHWDFLPVPGYTFSDSGTAACH